MRVHLINVGQGCATLIEFPCAAILVDAGGESNPSFQSNDSLKAYLDNFFDRRSDLNRTLSCFYLTHPHIDHTRGVSSILQSYTIKNAVTDGLEEGSGKFGQIKLHRAAEDAQATPSTEDDIGFDAVTTDEIGTGGLTDGVIDAVHCSGTDPVIKVLWGASPSMPSGWNSTVFGNPNNHSLVIRVEYGASSVLITGDLQDEAQHSLVQKYAGTHLLDADIYVVGHHGSRNGSSTELLDQITPQMALIGVGSLDHQVAFTAWDFGHPNKGILDRLQATLTATRPPIHIKGRHNEANIC